ncbi:MULTISPECIES: response regulator [Flavobacterium]|uniref:Response regulator transcription factor n=2 Tax=Flavobacterium TaxID=237 RepID=A0A941AVW6_9FLAO|nr:MULTISPECIES: response regulator transcription factor [Flavobacterium]MBP4138834.1 response regulator transcription factor [Flavobacterium geliluteum]MDX6182500.1 response regulator transcription factor [Flavobacterium sp. Fl-33]MDX6185587.1 response regulator transcription factor [Flavobacterium sp. Fl-77]UFH38775.1 response regulator transcription factor [Flavobacterium sp. F-70]
MTQLSKKNNFLLSDDHSVVRQGIALLIKSEFPSAEIYQAGTFKDTFKVLNETKIDIMILDINFPDGSSLNLISDILNIQPEIKILMFSAYDENIYAMRYLNAGASGYLNKGSTMEDMAAAIKSMVLTGKYLSVNVKNKILDTYISKKSINPIDHLSKREIEVAKLLIRGYGNLEISELLDIKKNTVSTFKNRIFEKLDLDNVADLIMFFQLYYEESQ